MSLIQRPSQDPTQSGKSGPRTRRSRNPRQPARTSDLIFRQKVQREAAIMLNRRGIRPPETKYIDASLSASAISTTLSLTLLNGITQGATATNRIGEQIQLTSIAYRLQFVGADATNYVRMLLVIDRQANGAAFGAADLLLNSTDPFSFVLEDNAKRFIIIDDQNLSLTLTGPDAVNMSKLIRMNTRSYYTGTGNTITGIKSNSFYACFISDSGAVSHPTVSGDFHLTFVDS